MTTKLRANRVRRTYERGFTRDGDEIVVDNDDDAADYVRLVNANGGVVAIDVKVNRDGLWLPEQMEVLKAVGHAAGTLKAR